MSNTVKEIWKPKFKRSPTELTQLRLKWLDSQMPCNVGPLLRSSGPGEREENVAYPGINRCDQFSDKKERRKRQQRRQQTKKGKERKGGKEWTQLLRNNAGTAIWGS